MTSPGSEKLQILLVDYEQAREEERSYQTVQITAIALAMTTVSLLGALAVAISEGTDVEDPVLAVAPLVALAPLFLIYHIGAIASVRSYYMRSLERTIRSEVEAEHSLVYQDLHTLPMLSYVELTVPLGTVGAAPTRTLRSLHVMTAVMYPVALAIFGGLLVYFSSHVTIAWRLVMLAVYGGAAITLLLGAVRTTVQARNHFEHYVDALSVRHQEGLGPRSRPESSTGGRSPLSYLLLPRPDDLLTKGVFLGLGVLLALMSKPSIPLTSIDSSLLTLLALWVAAEFLIYQARYQWNDIRGRVEDRLAPNPATRGRLPRFAGSVHWSWLVILVRLYLVLVIVKVGWPRGSWGIELSPAVLIALGGCFGIAVVYELARHWIRQSRDCSKGQLFLLLFLVGLGYPLRFTVGWLAVEQWGQPPPVAMIVALWALGVSFVGLTWVLEGASYFYVDENELKARKTAEVNQGKTHIEAILRLVGFNIPTRTATPEDGLPDGSNCRIILHTPNRPSNRQRQPSSRGYPIIPWNIGTAIWLITAGASAGTMTGVLHQGHWLVWLGAFSGAAIVLLVSPWAKYTPHAQIGGSVTLTVCYILPFFQNGTWTSVAGSWFRILVLLALVWTPALVYLGFRNLTYEQSRSAARKFLDGLVRWLRTAYAFISGDPPPKTEQANAGAESEAGAGPLVQGS